MADNLLFEARERAKRLLVTDKPTGTVWADYAETVANDVLALAERVETAEREYNKIMATTSRGIERLHRLAGICEAADDQDTGTLDAFREAFDVATCADLVSELLIAVQLDEYRTAQEKHRASQAVPNA